MTPRRGTGHGVTEAPRGMLYQRYELEDDGTMVIGVGNELRGDDGVGLEVARRVRASARRAGALVLADAIELAQALGRLPPSLIVYAIEGADYGPGSALSGPVATSVRTAAAAVMGELGAAAPASESVASSVHSVDQHR